jgi:hypothetical protein
MEITVKPYRIAVPESALERLQIKLKYATFPGETAFFNDARSGAKIEDIKRLVKHWQEQYD